MGRKTNSNILRLGLKKNEWNSKYLEQTIEESSLYVYKNLEIKNYIYRFFKICGLLVHNCKLCYSNQRLEVFISYYTLLKATSEINSNHKFSLKKSMGVSTRKKSLVKKRLLAIREFKTNWPKASTSHKFSEVLLESLTIFTNRNLDIFITFQNLNKNLPLTLEAKKESIKTQSINKTLLQLRKFVNANFFEETVSVVLVVIIKRNSAKLLSDFIALQLTNMKRHNKFLGFLKQLLALTVKSNFSCVYGIKIVITGRFNGAPRANKKIIQTGNVPLQSFNATIDYSEATSYTPNGTFGIKVWINSNL